MLTIVPTPIGNLGDITLRAIDALKSCDFIIAENPAHSGKLLQHLNIPKKTLVQFAEHNELKMLPKIISILENQNGVMVSDAGTPGIADPGFRLVRACKEKGIAVSALPGANAAITALSASGLPTDSFLFLGFLGKTEQKIKQAMEKVKLAEATGIFYESPQRITKTLRILGLNFPDANFVIARELTKVHEEYISGKASELLNLISKRQSLKGEIVLLVTFK